MADPSTNNSASLDDCIRKLQAKLPPAEHPALELRAQELMSDASADTDDVIAILRREFDPAV